MKETKDLKESDVDQDYASVFSKSPEEDKKKIHDNKLSSDSFSENCSVSDLGLNAKILNGNFHKFHLESSQDSYTSANGDGDVKSAIEMELKLKDSNENEMDPMLKNVIGENNTSVKILVNDSIESKRKSCCYYCCGPVVKFVIGAILIFLGLTTFIYTPFDFVMRERLKMMPGLPAFDWWLNPPENVFFKIYLFNITNSDRFMEKEDEKLNFEEIGPVVFKELLVHTNISFNDNDTLTYTARRSLKFLDDYNKNIDLNSTIYVPNLVILGVASYLHDANPFVKLGFRVFAGINASPILKTTIYNYLWNMTDPLLLKIRSIAPGLVPMENVGVLNMMYEDFNDEVTVFIGPNSGDQKFFTINKFHGMSTLPGFHNDDCDNRFEDATEGILYSQRLTNHSKLHYWRKTLCQVVSLDFNKEFDYNGVLAYEFILPNNTYHRSNRPGHPDCYAGNPLLVNGLSDVSKCYFDLPVATSLPHFYATDPRALTKITGMKPDTTKHSSFAIVEPFSGTPLNSCARSQSNLVVKKLSQMPSNIMLFSDMTLPMFWAEYSAPELPDYIWNLVIITVKVIPVVQFIISTIFVIIGLVLLYFACSRLKCKKSKSFHSHQQLDNFARKAIFRNEKEIYR